METSILTHLSKLHRAKLGAALLVVTALFFLIPALALAQNSPPVVEIEGPLEQSMYLGDSTWLHGTATDPDFDPIVGWQWEVISAPVGSHPSLFGDMPDALFTTDMEGNYLITLIAWDGLAWSDPDAVLVMVVENQPPEAVASATPTIGPAPLTVSFDGTGSYDPEGETLRYDWDFGDGGRSTEPNPTYEYQYDGVHQAVLTVADERGNADFDIIEITVCGSRWYPCPSKAKLLAPDGDVKNYFGGSVSIDGGVAVVGAPGDVNEPDPSYTGSAYVFQWNSTTLQWDPVQELIPSSDVLAGGDRFGGSVHIDGNVIVVGAADDSNERGTNAGAVYVFRHNGSTWEEEQRLLATDGANGDRFGFSVSKDGDVILVGAVFASEPGMPLNTGKAYVFRYNVDTGIWDQEQKLLASDAAGFDFIGFSVSISGDMALVGAPQDDDNGLASGSAYVFLRDGSTWVEQTEQKLLATNGGAHDQEQFGTSLFISGDMAVVGAPLGAPGGINPGSAYVFHWNNTTSQWDQAWKLLAADGADGDFFGGSVSIDGDGILVGASNDSNERGTNAGAAYLFRYNGSTWEEDHKLLAPDGAADDKFGRPLAISRDMAVVGAPKDADLGTNSGSVYVYNFYNDSDSDGINNSVDPDPLIRSSSFSDIALGGVTSGRILVLDGVAVEISDSPDPDEGVRVLVSGSPGGVAIIQIDGSVLWDMLEPGEHRLTYGSVDLRVVRGKANIQDPEGRVKIEVSAGGQAVMHETISEDGDLLALVVEAVGDTIIVNDEPVEPGDSITTIVSDSLDIKPGDGPNCINPTSHGKLTMAILASLEYDVTSIDESTIRLEDSISPIHSSFEDVNGDTIPDLVVQFLMEDLVGVLADGAILTITAQTTDGQQISGADVIYFAGGPNCLD